MIKTSVQSTNHKWLLSYLAIWIFPQKSNAFQVTYSFKLDFKKDYQWQTCMVSSKRVYRHDKKKQPGGAREGSTV